MYHSGSIFTPGTSIQGQLLRHAILPDLFHAFPGPSHRAFPILPKAVPQCGTPTVVPYDDGSMDVFVAGRVNFRNSPFCAPWPLSPLYLHTDGRGNDWELIQLPDKLRGRTFFVGGIPSALSLGDELIVYFNGGQLVEYTRAAGQGWQVAPVPCPEIVVEANPVSTIAANRIFVLAVPRGEYLLLCSRELTSSEWQFANLTSTTITPCHAYDGDPAVVLFAGKLHVLMCANSDRSAIHSAASELWDFVVDPLTCRACAFAISPDVSVAGTPSALVTEDCIRVFARSADDNLVEFSSADGEAWSVTDISATNDIGGDPAAVLLRHGDPLVCAVDTQGHLLQFTESLSGRWQTTRISDGLNAVERRPLPVMSSAGVSVFDLQVPL